MSQTCTGNLHLVEDNSPFFSLVSAGTYSGEAFDHGDDRKRQENMTTGATEASAMCDDLS